VEGGKERLDLVRRIEETLPSAEGEEKKDNTTILLYKKQRKIEKARP